MLIDHDGHPIELPVGVSKPRHVTEEPLLDLIFAFRYEVYVEEMKRPQYSADHTNRKVRDDLDGDGINIASFANGSVAGIARVNLPRNGGLGLYESMYNLPPLGTKARQQSAIVTRLMVSKAFRRTPLALFLAAACYEFGLANDVKACFIDCNPPLEGFFGYLQKAVESQSSAPLSDKSTKVGM